MFACSCLNARRQRSCQGAHSRSTCSTAEVHAAPISLVVDDKVLTSMTPEVSCTVRAALPDEPLGPQHPFDWRMAPSRLHASSCVVASHRQPLQDQGLQPDGSSIRRSVERRVNPLGRAYHTWRICRASRSITAEDEKGVGGYTQKSVCQMLCPSVPDWWLLAALRCNQRQTHART